MLVALTVGVANADTLGTAFTYNGRLTESGELANGAYDLRFTLFGAVDGAAALAGPIVKSSVDVANGLFVTPLDFGGAVFNGQARWLEIGVRKSGETTPYTVLAPRQELTPTPYALYAATANVSPGSITADAIASGAITAAKLDPAIGLWNKAGAGVSIPGWVGIGTSVPDAQLDLFGVLKFGAARDWWSDIFHNLYWGGTPATWRNTAQGPGGRLWIRGGANEPSGFGVQLSLLETGAPAGSDASLQEVFHIDQGGKAYFVNDVSIQGGLNFRDVCQVGTISGYYTEFSHNLYWDGSASVMRNRSTGPGTTMSIWGGALQPSGFGISVSSLPVDAPPHSDAAMLWSALVVNSSGNVGIGIGNPAAKLDVVSGVGRQISAGTWAEVSGSSGGCGLLGGNMYQDYWPPCFKYANTHAQIGAIGFAVNYPWWNTASVVCSGTESSTAGQAFTPKVIATFHPDGFVEVGALRITGGADLAEPFEVSTEDIVKGSVVVIDERNPGKLKLSQEPYDKKVAGVISGANGINPGITLKQEGTADGEHNVALSGRVYVLADASTGAIDPGDLLTTSATPGHAMKTTDYARAQGAILGKAMTALAEGRGTVLVLISLQ
ncbi:MAG TPA: hypothetical protein PKM73_17935 [Verrucomicrobiota bacterium]|nr:hypothetical protein [Verrucomicrobiota bacterium]HNU52085.1 hypothetical protein [Verrucomicrobiota bacterium]